MKIRSLMLTLLLNVLLGAFAHTALAQQVISCGQNGWWAPNNAWVSIVSADPTGKGNYCQRYNQTPNSWYTEISYNSGKTTSWVTLASLGLGTAPPSSYALTVNSMATLDVSSMEVDGVTLSLSSLLFTTKAGPFTTSANCESWFKSTGNTLLSGAATFTLNPTTSSVPVSVTITGHSCAGQ